MEISIERKEPLELGRLSSPYVKYGSPPHVSLESNLEGKMGFPGDKENRGQELINRDSFSYKSKDQENNYWNAHHILVYQSWI